jgi:hypothetical protein
MFTLLARLDGFALRTRRPRAVGIGEFDDPSVSAS